MSNAIERTLYGDGGVPGVTEFSVLPGVVRLRLTPWEGPKVHTVAVFNEARLTSVEPYPDGPEDFEMPWDVIGIDAYERGADRWLFVVHCSLIEFCFEAAWPFVTRSEVR